MTDGQGRPAQTGALNPITGFPIPERFEGGLVAIDGQGKFLFVLNPKSNNISMFQIDSASGVLSEVPASPFPQRLIRISRHRSRSLWLQPRIARFRWSSIPLARDNVRHVLRLRTMRR